MCERDWSERKGKRQGWERERIKEIQGGREKDRTRDRGGRERKREREREVERDREREKIMEFYLVVLHSAERSEAR